MHRPRAGLVPRNPGGAGFVTHDMGIEGQPRCPALDGKRQASRLGPLVGSDQLSQCAAT